MAPGDVANDRQSEARARCGVIELEEPVEDGLFVPRRNAGAFVGHLERMRIVRAPQANGHRAAAVQESVIHEISHHIAQILRAAAQRGRVGNVNLEAPTGGLRERYETRRDFADQPREIHYRLLERVGLTAERFLARQIEQLVDEPAHLSELALDRSPIAVPGEPCPLEPQSENGKWRAELVRRIGREAPLGRVGLREAIECAIHGFDERQDLAREPVGRDPRP